MSTNKCTKSSITMLNCLILRLDPNTWGADVRSMKIEQFL